MRVETFKVTSSGAQLPVIVEVKKVPRSKMLEHMTTDLAVRDNWCTHDKPCSKFGMRPCCPPQVKTFDQLKVRDHAYLIMVKIDLKDYYRIYPNVKESKSWAYFGMDGTHKMTRNISNKIVSLLKGQGFRVGGCLGCQFTKTGKCKRFEPALEATGINVVSLTEDVFGEKIKWAKPKNPMRYMIATGCVYTDEEVPASKFKELIHFVCVESTAKKEKKK
jgi:predicted metal-binding protein